MQTALNQVMVCNFLYYINSYPVAVVKYLYIILFKSISDEVVIFGSRSKPHKLEFFFHFMTAFCHVFFSLC